MFIAIDSLSHPNHFWVNIFIIIFIVVTVSIITLITNILNTNIIKSNSWSSKIINKRSTPQSVVASFYSSFHQTNTFKIYYKLFFTEELLVTKLGITLTRMRYQRARYELNPLFEMFFHIFYFCTSYRFETLRLLFCFLRRFEALF